MEIGPGSGANAEAAAMEVRYYRELCAGWGLNGTVEADMERVDGIKEEVFRLDRAVVREGKGDGRTV